MSALHWILLPAVGASIGFITNWVAVQMLFWPRQKVWGIQGLIPRRQQDFADTVAAVVSNQLVEMDDLLSHVDDVDLKAEVAPMIDKAIAEKADSVRNKYPLLKNFLDDERIAGWREAVLNEIESYKPQILDRIKSIATERVDVKSIAFGKLGGQDITRLEDVVKTIAKKEFRAIELWGAALGLLIGLIQAALLEALQ